MKVTDSGGLIDTKTITINVLDVNESPSQLNLTNQHVIGKLFNRKIVGQFSTVDEDVADIHTYTILTNPGNKFSIVGQDLVLTGALDYEADTNNFSGQNRWWKWERMTAYLKSRLRPDGYRRSKLKEQNVTRTTGHDYKTTQTTKLSRSIVHDTFEGGEIGQQSSFYMMEIFSRLFVKTTFKSKHGLKIKSNHCKVRIDLCCKVRSHDQSIANDVEDQNWESHY